ncbi:MAG: helix-turn-helix transcriptional regulator [Mesorhizobium sp.]|uniref:helix-turn-helix domain-containing protein n=1 Tax=Mesorhizobium sp. TaxID=1871066 RepID=UPI000FE9BF48|nr:AraC family transcriptional regulator [Mesorhizobium sp.]RWM20963.1 MAG: AraC family transcriptional regulator [Mesorhizobium sp.]TIP75874.1 MAG: helix-turn-helix transcriptional regulator [Mesorhizobium sp.]TIQ13684.1 MAG: helix-turn-helix transcriptional regulator [Mesorhizobium sp.]TIR53616.1 MAG: helix-turn-helix transcriptional regulator [Mesorhizobium sp.]TJV97743.1 MAG: helix-turn-helix transcriptional regulator [Mesorhizobium sp.]
MSDAGTATRWNFDQPPSDRLVVGWAGGQYETATRPFTARVEGMIAPRHHLLMATLKGGAARHAFTTDSGFRYEGRDAPGMISFLPAGCERRLQLDNVCWEWGAVAIDPELAPIRLDGVGPFASTDEPFLFGLVRQMHMLATQDGSLDGTYCDAMSLALGHYLVSRGRFVSHVGPRTAAPALTPRQLRQTFDRIDAMLSGVIRIRDLAEPLGLSEGHFHRAFRGSTGKSPLEEISERRVERAAGLLALTDLSVTEIALDVGLSGPSQLARLFRDVKATSPSAWRRNLTR